MSLADIQQVPTVQVSIFDIMCTTAFQRGVADARYGRAPRFDGDEFLIMPLERGPPGDMNSFSNRQWNYERGRQFGIMAPRTLNLFLPRAGYLNPAAVKFYMAHFLDPGI